MGLSGMCRKCPAKVQTVLHLTLVCGEDRIRTCGTLARTLPFQGSAFNHSATSPWCMLLCHNDIFAPDNVLRAGKQLLCVVRERLFIIVRFHAPDKSQLLAHTPR